MWWESLPHQGEGMAVCAMLIMLSRPSPPNTTGRVAQNESGTFFADLNKDQTRYLRRNNLQIGGGPGRLRIESRPTSAVFDEGASETEDSDSEDNASSIDSGVRDEPG